MDLINGHKIQFKEHSIAIKAVSDIQHENLPDKTLVAVREEQAVML